MIIYTIKGKERIERKKNRFEDKKLLYSRLKEKKHDWEKKNIPRQEVNM